MSEFLKKMRIPLIVIISVVVAALLVLCIWIALKNFNSGMKQPANREPRNAERELETGRTLLDKRAVDEGKPAYEFIPTADHTPPENDAPALDEGALLTALVEAPKPPAPVKEEECIQTAPEEYSKEESQRFPLTASDKRESLITDFIVDYNRRFVASQEDPILITVAANAPEGATFAVVRVYARLLSDKRDILTRDLVFTMPKIFVLNGRTQTQFYWAGKKFGGAPLKSGNYLLYAEIEFTDENDVLLGVAGRYPKPQWEHIVSVK